MERETSVTLDGLRSLLSESDMEKRESVLFDSVNYKSFSVYSGTQGYIAWRVINIEGNALFIDTEEMLMTIPFNMIDRIIWKTDDMEVESEIKIYLK